MTKTQILILAILVVLVIGVFAALAYLFVFSDTPAAIPAVETPAPATGEAAPLLTRPAVDATPAGPTPTEAPRVVVVTPGEGKTVAKATLAVTTKKTADASEKIEAAMRRMPVGEANLVSENDSLRMTMQRIGWLRIGQVWIKVKFTNKTDDYITVDPAHLTLIGQNEEEYMVEESASLLPQALPIVALDPGRGVSGDVSFRLPLGVAPAYLIYDDGVREPLKVDILGWIVSLPMPTPVPWSTPTPAE